MHKSILAITIAAAILLAGSLAWKAEAAPGGGMGVLFAARDFSPVVTVACGGPGPFCGWGRSYVCNAKKCWCAPCGRYKWHGWW